MHETSKQRHVRYFTRCLQLSPAALTPYDLARTSVGFFCFVGLDVLGAIETVDASTKANWVDWIYACQVPTGGFRGSPATALGEESIYDPAHIAATYFALASLLTLGDDLGRLDSQSLLTWLPKLQKADGSFASFLCRGRPVGETDMRFVYCAMAILSILQPAHGVIDYEKTFTYVATCRTFDGLFGSASWEEGHAGLTFCAIAAARLASQYIPQAISTMLLDPSSTTAALLRLQTKEGGFSGRANKPADTCYSFWAGAALRLLETDVYVSSPSNMEFLLHETQHRSGGFARIPGADPDPMHSCLALLSLSMGNEAGLKQICPALSITTLAERRSRHALSPHLSAKVMESPVSEIVK